MTNGQNQFQPGLWQLREAADRRPNDAAAAHALGAHLSRLKNYAAAIPHLRRALEFDPGSVLFLNSLALSVMIVGDREEAEELLKRAIKLDPANAESYMNLGRLYATWPNRMQDAAQAYRKAICCQPSQAGAYTGLSACLISGKAFQAAFAELLKWLPENSPADMVNGGFSAALMQQGRYPDAREFLESLLKTDPQNALAHSHLGTIALIAARDLQTAIRYHERALQLQPLVPGAISNYILDFLTSGDYQRAREEFHRWKHLFPKPAYEYVAWEGAPLNGKVIILRGDNGYGDTIQFARFASMLKQRGASVVLKVRNSLCRLLATTTGVDCVVSWEDECPKADFECDITDVAIYLDMTLEQVGPFCPYVGPHKEVLRHWAEIISPGPEFKVGLTWWGGQIWMSDPYRCRSIPFSEFEPLSKVKHVAFYSFQKTSPWDRWVNEEPEMWELSGGQSQFQLIDLTADMHDFMDTACAMLNMDLIITIDTSVAHLAGALGKPAWVLLPYAAAWPWLMERRDSPWYPTLRLFRQPEPGDWSRPMKEVAETLASEVVRH